jgi:lactoylglutathione lyase
MDGTEPQMNFQGVVMNVTDLDRSIGFYREILGFTLLSEKEQLAAMRAPDSEVTQIIVLRAIGSSPLAGARHIGLRSFVLEVEEADRLERIADELDSRKALLSRRDHGEWSAVVGRDPDGVSVVVAWHSGGRKAVGSTWRTLDDFLYGIGE